MNISFDHAHPLNQTLLTHNSLRSSGQLFTVYSLLFGIENVSTL